ncbi:TPA: HD domain-containing protein [bacterium]|nr:HD domain-containing protein [bacterium]
MSNSNQTKLDDAKILKELENLVKETFMLWDEIRVGFSWRHYFFNHTQRVRKLSMTIGKQEGADLRRLEYASLLHDITKRYDGNFLTDKDGKRVFNEDGLWLNEMLWPNPNKSNIVTELYKKHELAYKIHNDSGGIIAKHLLKQYGLDDDFCDAVASSIVYHLKPNDTSVEKSKEFMNNLEARIIYEADTMDSNLGLMAFFRNIGIHTHFAVQKNGRYDLKEYLSGIPRWLDMKDDFIPSMQTETGKKIGKARQQRNRDVWNLIEKELENSELNETYGIIGIVEYFMSCHEDPSMAEQMNYVDKVWLPERKQMLANENSRRAIAEESLNRAIEFHNLMKREMIGEI